MRLGHAPRRLRTHPVRGSTSITPLQSHCTVVRREKLVCLVRSRILEQQHATTDAKRRRLPDTCSAVWGVTMAALGLTATGAPGTLTFRRAISSTQGLTAAVRALVGHHMVPHACMLCCQNGLRLASPATLWHANQPHGPPVRSQAPRAPAQQRCPCMRPVEARVAVRPPLHTLIISVAS